MNSSRRPTEVLEEHISSARDPTIPAVFPQIPGSVDLNSLAYPSAHSYDVFQPPEDTAQHDTSPPRKRSRDLGPTSALMNAPSGSSDQTPSVQRRRRKDPCAQCAQAGVPDTCKQNRRTIGCIRCNAQGLACSFRVNTTASPEDLDFPRHMRNINAALSEILEQSKALRDRVVSDDQPRLGEETLLRMQAHIDERLAQMEARIQEELGLMKALLHELLSRMLQDQRPLESNQAFTGPSTSPPQPPSPSNSPDSKVLSTPSQISSIL